MTKNMESTHQLRCCFQRDAEQTYAAMNDTLFQLLLNSALKSAPFSNVSRTQGNIYKQFTEEYSTFYPSKIFQMYNLTIYQYHEKEFVNRIIVCEN